jgi:hypothetical protein
VKPNLYSTAKSGGKSKNANPCAEIIIAASPKHCVDVHRLAQDVALAAHLRWEGKSKGQKAKISRVMSGIL